MNFGYDANGRMVKATKASVPDALSVYDAAGLRVAEKINDVWRFLIYDVGGKLVSEYGGLQSTDEGGVKYLMSDWQGSTRAVLSNSGFVLARNDYTTFGEEIGSGVGLRTAQQGFGSSVNVRQKYGLTERDDATGIDHTWFRKHENRAGRWTSPDPYNGSMSLGNPQSFNRFSYVENQPTNFIDPSGLNASSGGFSWSCWVTWRSDWDGSNFRITSVSCQTWSNAGGQTGGGPLQNATSNLQVIGDEPSRATKIARCYEDFKDDILDIFTEQLIETLGIATAVVIVALLTGGTAAVVAVIAGAAAGVFVTAKAIYKVYRADRRYQKCLSRI